METDDMELDVEGIDDDGPSSLGLGIDPNELPSVSSHLSPELSQHPWLTFDEQFNSHIPSVILRDDMDESSRATIHQMIIEEHSYLKRKKFMRRKNKGLKTLFTSKREKKLSYTRWTEEEKDLFKKGIDKHGHSWKEIADMIKTRNPVQVKNYARNYLQNQASNDGQDFSSKCSVKFPESRPSERLEEDEDGNIEPLSLDDDEEEDHVTKGDQHLLSLDDEEEEEDHVTKGDQHLLSLDDEEEEEDVDIDVEETSESEQREQGLQSTLLFGDILRHSVHTSLDDILRHSVNTSSDDQQNEEFILSGNNGLDSERMTILKLEDPDHSPSERRIKSEIGADDIDVNVSSYVAALIGSKISLNKTHNHSSEEDEGLTICLSGEGKNTRTKRRGKGSTKRTLLEETSSGNESNALTVPPIRDSLETTPESNLPGNLRSGREHKTDQSKRMKEGVKHGKRKGRRKPVLVKTEETLHLETKQENHDHHSEGYMEVEVKKEEDICDCKGDLMTSGMKTVFVRSKDYSELCQNSVGENSAVQRIFKSEPDVAATADTQHVSDVGSREQDNISDYATDQSLKESKNQKLESSHHQGSRDQTSSLVLPISVKEGLQTNEESHQGSRDEASSIVLPMSIKEGLQTNEESHQGSRDQTISLVLPMSIKEGLQTNEECLDAVSDKDCQVDLESTKEHQDLDDEGDKNDRGTDKADGSSHYPRLPTRGDDSDEEESSRCEHIQDQSCEESDEETVEPPKEEMTLDPSQVTDGEKEAHPIYFDFNSSAKTPQRYLAIRNHIIKCWLKMKPTYLNKTAARSGLRSGGDVNLIGQIHEYLEAIGAINFGAYNPNLQKCKKRRSTVERWALMHESKSKTNRVESMRPRRKIMKRKPGEEKPSSVVEKQKKPRSRQPKAQAYDPFKLIDCYKFSSSLPAPFSVKVKGSAIVTMDVHSHLSTTEVIGLLGGDFDPEQSVLDVRLARPCRSLSTGMQCEMDPVSQTEACEDIQSAGCRVVGWYHSHPTFSPNPSIRDVETQGHFQEWFSQDTKTPFIGVIVSPYHSRQLITSKINCITVSQEWSQDLQCWRPYMFDFSVYQDKDEDVSHQHLLSTASQLISQFAQYKYRVEMLWVCPGQSGITYLEKMLQSISTNLCGSEETKAHTLSKLKNMVYDLFGNHCSTIIKDSTVDVTLSFDSSP